MMKARRTRRIGSFRAKNAKRKESAREASAKQIISKTESKQQAKRKQTGSKKKAPSNHAGCCLLYALALDNIEDPLVAALDLLLGQAIEAIVVLPLI